MSREFERKLAVGKIGESLIARWLRSRGNYVLPVYEIEMNQGKGPQLFPPITGGIVSAGIIAPDLLAFKQTGDVFWIEAKHKSAFTPHRKSGGTLTTGIDLHHYRQYVQLLAESPWPIWLLFLHRGRSAANCPENTPTGLFGNDLKYLAENVHHTHDNWGKSGMVYWAIDSLIKMAELEQVDYCLNAPSSPSQPPINANPLNVSQNSIGEMPWD